jgi:hypothetical protein
MLLLHLPATGVAAVFHALDEVVRQTGDRLSPYAPGVLSELRAPDGGPRLRVRLLALVVVVGLLVLTAPLVVLPLLEALLNALF